MKKLVFSTVACLATVVSLLGIYPTSWFAYYQPETPEELLR